MKYCVKTQKLKFAPDDRMLLRDSDYIDGKRFESIHTDSSELTKLLVSIVKTSKQNNGK